MSSAAQLQDAYYVFIICGKFGGVEAVSERFAAEYTTETRRHFGLESHHPEYESINAARHLHCNEVSIAEMAIDRLDRNLAPSGGRDPIDWNLMNKYKPVFSSGDVEGKQMLFLQYVHDYESVVRRVILASGGGHSVTSKSPTVAAETADDRKEVEGGFVLVDNLDADESESESLCRGCHHHRKKPSISFVSGRVTIVI